MTQSILSRWYVLGLLIISTNSLAESYDIREWIKTQPQIVQDKIDVSNCRYPKNIEKLEIVSVTCLGEERTSLVIYKGKYGILNAEGDWVMLPKYDYITLFTQGTAVVEEGAHKFLINPKGEWIADIE
ncbi:WG repeat-containing protein [Psychrobacter sp. I-STPA10]|uniref:WG repeat-containing protein n=1 Tax=Psychrobacter sp. I-STPA10 TaxID=2585769 RepID=UPI001E43CA4D|nr:WG repeat-containing protein [Psychrobacter sp. I-STPA10]